MLIEQSLLWLAPFACLMLLMVFAMMQFTAALLVKRPTGNVQPIDAGELKAKLLALNKKKLPYRVVEGTESDLELEGDNQDQKVHYRAWLMLDDSHKEVRGCESLRGRQRVLGMSGTGYSAAYGVQKGYLGIDSAVSNAVAGAGWTYRPVLFRYQAKQSGARMLDSLTPGPMKRWTYLRFWSVAYVLTFVIGMLSLGVALWPQSLQYIPMMLAMSVAWWAIWGLIAWVALGLPKFWIRSG